MTLRETALRSGAHVLGREVVGLVIRFAGALLVTRIIGPSSFGLFAGALVVATVFSTAAQLGGEVYLIRREEEPSRRLYDEVFTVLLCSSAVAVLLGFVGSVAAAAVIDSSSAVVAFQVLLLWVPLSVLWAPAQAKLERAFRFRALAFLQVGSDAALYAVATALALAGVGVWAPIAGTVVSSGLFLVGSYVLANYRPRIGLSRAGARDVGRFGLQFVPAPLLWTSANLINPLVVGAFLGSASVGYVALATRLADTAGFVLRATYRVSLVALSRVQSDTARLRRGFEEMLVLQAIGVGVPLVGLAVAAPALVPLLFGDEWRPTLEVLPFVSFSLLMLGMFNTHLSLLYVLGRTLTTSTLAFVRFVLLGSAALVLVPSLELTGYGIAILVSTSAWVLADRSLRRRVSFHYGPAARWALVLTPPLFIPLLDMPWALVLLGPAAVLLLVDKASRAQLRGYGAFARRSITRSTDGPMELGEAPVLVREIPPLNPSRVQRLWRRRK
jgi:O-antigen/teichoic acid export membrane protein